LLPVIIRYLADIKVKMFIDCNVEFTTEVPMLECIGKMILLPVPSDLKDASVTWRIWVLSTWSESISQFPEDLRLLQTPRKTLDGPYPIQIDVVIIGAGSS
jgi:hypothetical protein